MNRLPMWLGVVVCVTWLGLSGSAEAQCGDELVQPPEECDPPGSNFTCPDGANAICEADCMASCAGDTGDPHLRTLDDNRYDFQSAGEFVAMRDSAGTIEVQTRQSAVATGGLPGPDPHSGLRVCVSVNTAVAARVGSHRVSYQPSGKVEAGENRLELRVDGKVVKLGKGIDLDGGARILPTNVPDGLSITFPDKSSLVVTPGWWAPYQQWYLNLSFASSTAKVGLLGPIAEGSWLPALPDGQSVGAMPDAPDARYDALYRKFADAWRVTDATSLFDYAQGTTTATFTSKDWPTMGPTCEVAGQQPAQAATEQVARDACKGVGAEYANCVYDVMATGHLGFATTYLQGQQVRMPTTTTPPGGGKPDCSACKCEEKVCECPPDNSKQLLLALGVAVAVILVLIALLARRK